VQWLALTIVCLAMLMNALDQTIVNVALPSIQRSLNFAQGSLAWVVDAYLITFGGGLLIAGRLGDLVGRKKVFLAGVALFTLASAACAAADSQSLLIGARFVQGFGAALSSSVIIAILIAEFPDAVRRTKAMSVYVFVAVGGGAVGLLLGGALTQELSWHWIFLINLPVGALTLLLGSRFIAENQGQGIGGGIDVLGAVLSTAGLVTAIYAIVTGGANGWASVHTLGFGLAAVALLTGFAIWESRVSNPIMPLRILRSRGLMSANLIRGLVVMGFYATFFIGALFVENVLGYDTIRTGLAFLPMSLALLATSLGGTAALMARLGAKKTSMLGVAILAGGLLIFVLSGPTSGYFPYLFLAFLLIGLGGGTLFVPLLSIAISDVAPSDAGLGSGIANVAQQVSAAVGVAVLGTISSEHTAALRLQHSANALDGGYHLAFLVALSCVVAGFLLCSVLLPNVRGRSTEMPVPSLE
jgi:EmrB/QacA subfamily drug resistance transporter